MTLEAPESPAPTHTAARGRLAPTRRSPSGREPAVTSPGLARPGVTTLLRVRWRWLVAGSLLGILLAVAAAGRTAGAGYQAEAVLQLASTSGDANILAQEAASTVRLGVTEAVLQRAATQRRVELDDLESRTTVVLQDSTDLITVRVVAEQEAAAIADANAVATALVAVHRQRATQRLQQSRAESQRILAEEVLTDVEAEQNRQLAIGNSLGVRQEDLARNIGALTPFDTASQTTATRTPFTVAAPLGATAGLALAAALALLAGPGRRRVQRASDLGLLGARVQRVPLVAERLVAQLMERRQEVVVVLAMPGAQDAGREIAHRLVRVLRANGVSGVLLDVYADRSHLGTFGGLPQDADRLAGGLRVVLAPADDEAIEVVAAQARLLAVLVTSPGSSSVRQMQEVSAALGSDATTVVLWS